MSSAVTKTALAGGLALPASAVTLTITADVNGTPTSGSGITPSQSFSHILVPTYSPNPSADHALIQKKTFCYFEQITNKFTVAPGQSFTWTGSNGIANPKRLIMQPVITNPNGDATVSDTINPFRSPFSQSPLLPHQARSCRLSTKRRTWMKFGTDSISNLFQQVMTKNREYEYDEITKKLTNGPKGPPKVIKGKEKKNVEEEPQKKTKFTYVPTSTDVDVNIEHPTATEDASEEFDGGVNEIV